MGIDPEDGAGRPTNPLARRSLLRRAAAGVLGGAVAAFGLVRPSAAAEQSAPPSTDSSGGGVRPDAWQAYCCTLLWGLCTTKQINDCSKKWTWTCCAYVGSYLQRVTCGECESSKCSWYSFGSAC